MRWRRRTMLAVAVVAIAGLAGCADPPHVPPPVDSTSPTPSLSDEELIEASRETYQGFLDELYAMYAEFDYDYTRLTPYVSDELASESVADMRQMHGDGFNLASDPQVVAALMSTALPPSVEVCVDSSGGSAYSIETGEASPVVGSQITAWRLEVSATGRRSVLIESSTPLYEESNVCAQS